MAAPVFNETITITFGDCAENNRGMQQIGDRADTGLTMDNMKEIRQSFVLAGAQCEWYDLRALLPADKAAKAPPAVVLVARGAVTALIPENGGADAMLVEQQAESMKWDKHAKMYGVVREKKARHNLCYSHIPQEPDYAQGKGTIVAYSDVPHLNALRLAIGRLLSDPTNPLSNLQGEGNRYYAATTPKKMPYIGFHGDTERRIVVAARLGATFTLYYQWYEKNTAVGQLLTLQLSHGDMYVMSDAAVGYNWLPVSRPGFTLRHAAGPRALEEVATKLRRKLAAAATKASTTPIAKNKSQ